MDIFFARKLNLSRILTKLFYFFLAGTTFFLIACLFFKRLEIGDIWFHLQTGKIIAHQGTLPFIDQFSYTSNVKWLATQWLGDVIFYWIYRAFGQLGLQLFRCVFFTSVLGILFYYLRRSLSIYTSLLVIVPVAFILSARSSVRPYIFNILFIQLYFYILSAHHKKPFNKIILIIPFLQLIWQNIFIGGAYLSILMLLIFLIGIYFDYRFLPSSLGESWHKKTRVFTERNNLFMLTGACLFCLFLNPYRLEGLAYPLKIFLSSVGTFRTKDIIVEWMPSFRSLYDLFNFNSLMYLVTICITLISLLSRIKKACKIDLVLFFTFLLISLLANRFKDVFSILSAAIFAKSFFDCKGQVIREGVQLGRLYKRVAKAACTLFLFTALVVHALEFFFLHVEVHGKKVRKYGVGVDLENNPAGALRFIDGHNLSGNIFNSIMFGPYMLWEEFPKRRVFIDGRTDLYCFSGVLQKLFSVKRSEDWENLVREYDIAIVVLNTRFSEGRDADITRYLLVSNKWTCVFLDGPSVVFLRNDRFDAKFLKEHRILPFENNDLGLKDFDRYLKDAPVFTSNPIFRWAYGIIKGFPDPLELVTKGNWFVNIGSFGLAQRTYLSVLTVNPLLRDADFWIGYCFYKQDRDDYAEVFVKRALRLTPSDPKVLLLAAEVAASRDNRLARKYYLQAARRDPNNRTIRKLFADFAFKKNLIKEALWGYGWLNRRDPQNVDYQLRLGVLYGKLGQINKARQMLEEVLAEDPNNRDALFNLAVAYRYLGLNEPCKKALEKVISLDPANRQAKAYLLELQSLSR